MDGRELLLAHLAAKGLKRVEIELLDGRELLLAYLAAKSLRQADCSRETGITTGMLSHWLTEDEEKRRRPGLEHAHTLETWSHGAVPAESWIPKKPGSRASRKSGRSRNAA